MGGFEPLVVRYLGQEKTIPASDVMRVAAEVESYISYGSINILLSPQHFNFALVASAYFVLIVQPNSLARTKFPYKAQGMVK